MPRARTHPYDVHPSVAMIQKWVAELPAKSGKTLDQWAKLIRTAHKTIDKPADLRQMMKAEHGFTTNPAAWIVEYSLGLAAWDADPVSYLANALTCVDAQYAGGKAHLRPIYDALVAAARALGPDVLVCPCKTMVPFYRSRVFAEVKPATKAKVTLSLAFGPDFPESGVLQFHHQRLKKGDRLTHIIDLATPADVTPEVTRWLKAAYDKDGAKAK